MKLKDKPLFHNINTLIATYLLPVGFLFFLCGILFFSSFSAYHTQIYIFLIVPTLVFLIKDPEVIKIALSSQTFRLLIVLFIFAGISVFWNTPEANDFKYIKRLLIILLFILSIIILVKNNEQQLIKLLLLAAVIYSMAAFYSIYNDYFIENKPLSSRIIGLGNLSNPLLSSHIYGIFSALVLGYYFSAKRAIKENLVLLFVFTGLICFVLLTNSRTPLLGLGSVFILLLLMHQNKKLFYVLIVSGILFALYIFLNYDNVTARGLSYRPEIWSISLQKIFLKPFIGHGLGTDINIYIKSLDKIFMDTHNIHLGITYKLGFTGLIIWLLILISAIKIYLNNKDTVLAQLGIVLLIYGISSSMTEGFSFLTRPKEVWFLTWLPISLLLGVEIKNKFNNRIKIP